MYVQQGFTQTKNLPNIKVIWKVSIIPLLYLVIFF